MMIGSAACNGQPDETPAGLGTASDHTAAPRFTRSPAPFPTLEATGAPKTTVADPLCGRGELEPQAWRSESQPYSCLTPSKDASARIGAGMNYLGGSALLSLNRCFGNGSYLCYGLMGFEECEPMRKQLERTRPGPTVYRACCSSGDLDIAVDIARVPPDAPGRFEGGGSREAMGTEGAANILDTRGYCHPSESGYPHEDIVPVCDSEWSPWDGCSRLTNSGVAVLLSRWASWR